MRKDKWWYALCAWGNDLDDGEEGQVSFVCAVRERRRAFRERWEDWKRCRIEDGSQGVRDCDLERAIFQAFR